MSKNVVLWMGAGQIGMAIARRIGYGKKIIIGDKSAATASYYYGPLQPQD